MNLSETAFVKPLGKNHFHIRWFTPKVEVKLCGHATLASAHILHEEKLIFGDEIIFESLSGPLRVFGKYTLDFPLQKTGPVIKSPIAGALLAVKAYDDIIVELPDAQAVRNFSPSGAKLSEIDCRGIIITARGDAPYDFVSRFFAPKVGVDEDPVTGSAHCKLAHYWEQKLGKSNFFAYQASVRGGEITLSIAQDRVHLTGSAVTILKGTWLPSC